MKRLKVFCLIFTLCSTKLALSLENDLILENSKLASTPENGSFFFDNLEYHWLNCNYSTVIIHKVALRTEDCRDRWIDFCLYPRSGVCVEYHDWIKWKKIIFKNPDYTLNNAMQYMCLGLFCDITETVTSNFQCEASETIFNYPLYQNVTYVYFKPNREKSHRETDSEKYLESLNSNLKNLKMKRINDSENFMNQILVCYGMVQIYAGICDFFSNRSLKT